MGVSAATTQGIRVEVESRYLPSESDPANERYFFTYTVRLHNEGAVPAQLISRHWIITDELGAVEEVRGPGVVGKQPHLRPGESFEYASYCPLRTPLGHMRGSYFMRRDDGVEFEARIESFSLEMPHLMS